jgi:hypothetical protein
LIEYERCGVLRSGPDRVGRDDEVALKIEAELAGVEYDAMPDELAAIDDGSRGKPQLRKKSKQPSSSSALGMRVDYSKAGCHRSSIGDSSDPLRLGTNRGDPIR